MDYTRSEELFKESQQYMPGGVNSPVRAFRAVNRNPVFIKKAKGSRLYDVDGNAYIDYVSSWGPGILGHAQEEVVEAVKNACEEGLTFGAPTEKETILAKMVTQMVPSMELVRLVSSGTEAVMSAIRAARGYTGRHYIVKFRGCYHGHSDGLLVKAGSGALTESRPDSLGIPADFTKYTLVADFNNKESVEELFALHGADVAGVIVEPVPANMGLILPEPGFLKFLREITSSYGSLLIFDEVITGFRLALGGAQEYFQIQPDLTTLGKIIGGGMPMGAYGGKKEIMEVIAPLGGVYQAGTLSGNPIATTAGIKTLEILKNKPQIYQELEQKSKELETVLKYYLGEQAWVNRVGSLLSVFFTREKVWNYETALTSDTKAYGKYFNYMLDHGIYLAPSQFEAMFVSNAITSEDIEKTGDVLKSYSQL